MALDPLLARLVLGFASEADEIIANVTSRLLFLERDDGDANARAEAYDEVARGLHTLKGTSGSLGLAVLETLAHCLEDRLAPARAARGVLEGAVASTLLRGLDAFKRTLRAAADGKDNPSAEAALLELEPRDVSRGSVHSGEASAAEEPAVARVDEAAFGSPALDESALRVDARHVAVLIREVELLRELRLQLEERRSEVARVVALAEKVVRREGAAELDSRLRLLERAIRADAEEAGAVLHGLEDAMKSAFLQPLRSVLEPLHRSMRDQCRAVGKEAALSIVGAELSLDRRLLDAVRVACVQLVRNAIDHGIEAPSERSARGKHREGIVVVRAEQHGNIVTVEVSDDGDGLDYARIKRVALERDLAPAEDLAKMTEAETARLLFVPGFSTRTEVSTTSGRGVGLDLVRSRIEGLGGSIEVSAAPGQGTRFLMSVPIEFGSSPLLVVRAGEHDVAVPMLAIETLLRADPAKLTRGRGSLRLSHNDEFLVVHELAVLLGARSETSNPARGAPLMIVQSDGQKVAVSVDEVVGERELTVFALPAELRHLPAFQGASTRADGALMLVLKPEWLVSAAPVALREAPRALVVDDSLTARALHRAILEAGGFTVHTASDGAQALRELERTHYDVVVCDVAMSPLDGFAFLRGLRSSDENSAVPVVMVSARDESAMHGLAITAGADAFVSKRDCASGRLLGEVKQAILRRKGAA